MKGVYQDTSTYYLFWRLAKLASFQQHPSLNSTLRETFSYEMVLKI